MPVLKICRGVSLAVFMLSLMLLFGVRMYEIAYIYSSEVQTVTHVITPMLFPVIAVSGVLLLVFVIVCGIVSLRRKAILKKNSV